MFPGVVIDIEGNVLALEGNVSGRRLLTGVSVVLIELWFSVLCWELCDVEAELESGGFVTVAFAVVNSFFMTPLVGFPSSLIVVVNEESVGSKGEFKDSFFVVPLGDAPDVDSKTGFGIMLAVDTDISVARVDSNTPVIALTPVSSLLL